MKTLVPQEVSRSVLSLSICGYLPCSGQKCQKFARNHPQGYPRNFHSAIHRTDHSQSPPSPHSYRHPRKRRMGTLQQCAPGLPAHRSAGSDEMIFSDPLPDCAHQAGGSDALVAGDKRGVETNRRSGNQAVKRIDQQRQSARCADIGPDQRFDWQCRKLCHPVAPIGEAKRALHPPALQQYGQLKEADDRNVYSVPLLLGAAENLSSFTADPRCLATGEKDQCVSVGDVGHFRPERRRLRSSTSTEAAQNSPRRRLSAINSSGLHSRVRVPSSVGGGFARRVELFSRRYSSAETSSARSRPYLPIATGAPPQATRSTNWLRRLRASLIRSGVVIVYLYKNVVTTSNGIDEPSEPRADSLFGKRYERALAHCLRKCRGDGSDS